MHSSDVGHQVDQFRMQEQDWATKEQDYRKRIQQLEAKVGGEGGSGKLCMNTTNILIQCNAAQVCE